MRAATAAIVSARPFRSISTAIALGVMLLHCSASASTPATRTHFYIQRTATTRELMVFPPRDQTTARPVVVMLHGKCDSPENECPRLADAFAERSWLVCPRGEQRCSNGGSSWAYPRRTHLAEEALAVLRARYPDGIDEVSGHTLAGFSLGAYAALDCSHLGTGTFRHLLLIGAKVQPMVARLQAAGIVSVVLLAGQKDETFDHMGQQATVLSQQGIASRFFGLGPVGHWFPSNINWHLREAMVFGQAQSNSLRKLTDVGS